MRGSPCPGRPGAWVATRVARPIRSRVYIDGFNLYYGLVRQTPYKWLDRRALCQANYSWSSPL